MSIPFDDIVFAHGTGNAHALKSMIIIHSYQLDFKPDTENFMLGVTK